MFGAINACSNSLQLMGNGRCYARAGETNGRASGPLGRAVFWLRGLR